MFLTHNEILRCEVHYRKMVLEHKDCGGEGLVFGKAYQDCICRRAYVYVRELVGTGIPDMMLGIDESSFVRPEKIRLAGCAVIGSGITGYLSLMVRRAVLEGKRAAYFWPEDLAVRDENDDSDEALKLVRIKNAEVLCLDHFGSGPKWVQERVTSLIQRSIDNGVVVCVGIEDPEVPEVSALKNLRVVSAELVGPVPQFDWTKLQAEAEKFTALKAGNGETKNGRKS